MSGAAARTGSLGKNEKEISVKNMCMEELRNT